jgi:hypothetical protein
MLIIDACSTTEAHRATNNASVRIEMKTQNHSILFTNWPPRGPEFKNAALRVEQNRSAHRLGSARDVALLQCIQTRVTFFENFETSIINFRAISADRNLKFQPTMNIYHFHRMAESKFRFSKIHSSKYANFCF